MRFSYWITSPAPRLSPATAHDMYANYCTKCFYQIQSQLCFTISLVWWRDVVCGHETCRVRFTDKSCGTLNQKTAARSTWIMQQPPRAKFLTAMGTADDHHNGVVTVRWSPTQGKVPSQLVCCPSVG